MRDSIQEERIIENLKSPFLSSLSKTQTERRESDE